MTESNYSYQEGIEVGSRMSRYEHLQAKVEEPQEAEVKSKGLILPSNPTIPRCPKCGRMAKLTKEGRVKHHGWRSGITERYNPAGMAYHQVKPPCEGTGEYPVIRTGFVRAASVSESVSAPPDAEDSHSPSDHTSD